MATLSPNENNVLAPIPDSGLNRRDVITQVSKKRKRETCEAEDLPSGSFLAVTLPKSSQTQSLHFIFLVRLVRSDLPLAWLAPASSDRGVPQRFLFYTPIPLLQNDPEQTSSPVVNIVRHVKSSRSYAVERIQKDVYLALLLASWITEDHIHSASSCVQDILELLLSDGQNVTRNGPSKQCINSENIYPMLQKNFKSPKYRRGVRARLSILAGQPGDLGADPNGSSTPDQVSPVDMSFSAEHVSQQVENCPVEQSLGAGPVCGSPIGSQREDQTKTNGMTSTNDIGAELSGLQEIFHKLRQQYLEMLYLSKTSLAYFTKGPLTRARTQIRSNSGKGAKDLANFYLNSLLTAKKMDLKYKESISSIVLALPQPTVQVQEDIPDPGPTDQPSRKRVRKIQKLGKNGLFQSEANLVKRWWNSQPLAGPCGTSANVSTEATRNALSDLRNREAAMQILLILEILALEKEDQKTASEPAQGPLKKEPDSENMPIILSKIPTKPSKKKRDLQPNLEMLVDRLCIWHTIESEVVEARTKTDGKATEVKDKNSLRNFCMDVLIPFYAVRLPDECKKLCRKLGGPEISPKKSKSQPIKSSISSKRPPSADKDRWGRVSRPSLERVLSEDQGSRHSAPPVLPRSSTAAPPGARLRRASVEPSERPTSRAGLQKTRGFTVREIDLVADAKANELKQKKWANLAEQKREIDAAISALRKPNRTRVANEFVDEIERRKKEGAGIATRTGLAVHIAATPKRARPGSSIQRRPSSMTATLDHIAGREPADGAVIPSSTLRPRSMPASSLWPSKSLECVSSPANNETLGSSSLATDSRGVPESSSEGLVIEATPSANRIQPHIFEQVPNTPLRMKKSQRPVLFTPLMKNEVTMDKLFRDIPEISEKAGKTMERVMGGGREMSIYDALGWNDDFDGIA